MTPKTIKEGFINALHILKETALAEKNINITFAILSVPDIFNNTVKAIVKQACEEVGIHTAETIETILPRSMAGAWGADFELDARTLLLDQGKFHFGVGLFQQLPSRKRQKIVSKFIPMDTYGSTMINQALTTRMLEQPGVLREQVRSGADRNQLQVSVKKARFWIKDNLDVLAGQSDEDHHHKERPLDLKGWWMGQEQGAVLKWEDVEVVEDEYVEKAQATNRLNLKVNNFDGPLEDIDGAVIMTDYINGELLKRAISETLGRKIEVVGGAVTSNMFPAKDAARLALKRAKSWYKLQRYTPSIDENMEHNEL